MRSYFSLLWLILVLIAIPITACTKEKAVDSGKKPVKEVVKENPLTPAQKRAQAINKMDLKSCLNMALEHMEAIFGILHDNIDDCQRAVNTTRHYMDEQTTEIKLVAKRYQALRKNMSAAEKKKFSDTQKKRLDDWLKKFLPKIMEFSQKCPQDFQKVGSLFEAFKGFSK
jgi:capsule polysaccharide export protein KpsE/RkpR